MEQEHRLAVGGAGRSIPHVQDAGSICLSGPNEVCVPGAIVGTTLRFDETGQTSADLVVPSQVEAADTTAARRR